MNFSAKKRENLKLQKEEIEALKSVYGNKVKLETGSNKGFSMEIDEFEHPLVLSVSFPSEYPVDGPPTYRIYAPYLSNEEMRCLRNELEENYLKNIGDPVSIVWVEAVREFMQKKADEAKIIQNEARSESNVEEHIEEEYDAINSQSVERFSFTHGETIIDRKSVFQGHAVSVLSAAQVRQALEQLKEDKKVASATHNIYAYRIRGPNGCILQDCDDDGETRAGGRLLHVLSMMDIYDVMVVVTRWYGGILLGPDRFKHILNAARQVLEAAGFIVSAGSKKVRH